jgi:hypothetical protein
LQKEDLVSDHDNFCAIEQTGCNTTIFYPHDHLDWDESSAFVSRDLKAPVFSFHIHDGDFWMYILYFDGEVVDRFNPIPDYWNDNFNTISEEEIDSWKGHAELLTTYIPGLGIKQIENYLIRWDLEEDDSQKAYEDDKYAREDWQLVDFMRKLGLHYPLEDFRHPTGQSYRLWTKNFSLQGEKDSSASASKAGESPFKKPWWKFW